MPPPSEDAELPLRVQLVSTHPSATLVSKMPAPLAAVLPLKVVFVTVRYA